MQSLKIALIITYDGTLFDGWQDNLSNKSIEGLLKKAFFNLYNKPFKLDAASRTDKGVHALSQVVITSLDEDKIPLSKLDLALNSQLPDQIRVKKVIAVPKDFHPSLSCKRKTYSYQLDLNLLPSPFKTHTHWHTPFLKDIQAMEEAAHYLKGQKDFSSFCNSSLKPSFSDICQLDEIKFIKSDNLLTLEITADRFLYKMCRIIVGTLVDIGSGKLTLDHLKDLFKHKKRSHAGVTAPSHGLFLKELNYSEFTFIG